jgi:N-acylglucosamine 2-epimerase
MRRREFLGTALAAGFAGAVPAPAGTMVVKPPFQATAFATVPSEIAGMSLAELRDDYRNRLFNEYLPFWEKGGIDRQYGGIMCELNGDGTVFDGLKNSWYQGRGLWVYSFLYNHFGQDRRWLDVADGIRKFLGEHMVAGGGKWYDKTRRDGTVIEGVGPVIFGWLFIAEGLTEYARAVGNKKDLELAKESIRTAIQAYDSPDYSRFPEYAGCMYTGHTIETYWMVMFEALRRKDRKLFDTAKDRLRRLIELSWDYIFSGCASMDYLVFDLPDLSRGPKYEVKTMWAQCEILIGCMTALEYTGEVWAKEWYERARAFALRTMPCEARGVWRQAVDRFGKNHERKGLTISTKRRGNYHQPRSMMLNLLSLERMIRNQGKLTPFPG